MSLLKNKVVLVTGVDGFIGSHLTEMLVNRGARVKALSYYNSFNYWGLLEVLDCLNDEVLTGAVRDPHYCKQIAKNVDTIFLRCVGQLCGLYFFNTISMSCAQRWPKSLLFRGKVHKLGAESHGLDSRDFYYLYMHWTCRPGTGVAPMSFG